MKKSLFTNWYYKPKKRTIYSITYENAYRLFAKLTSKDIYFATYKDNISFESFLNWFNYQLA